MKLSDLPEIDFATADPQQMAVEVVGTVEKLLGRTLERADPLRIFLRGVEAIIIQQRLLIDQTAKMNLLAYATGNFLDHLGALVGCERLPASKSVTTVEITLSAARRVATTIAAGTRITAGDDVYFEIEDDVIFLRGETVKTAKAICTVTGEVGNGYAPGELSRIVDPQPFLQNMTNTTTSEGGADIEADDEYRERIHEAPEAFSCAGSGGAYRYHAKSVSTLISDVAVESDLAGNVQVYIILKDGLARRCQVVMQGTDEGELTSYFSEGCLRTDPALSIARQGNSPYQLYYSITGFDHRLNLTSIWSWPWEDTVRVTLEERVPAIDGRLNTAGREWADALGLTGAPPRWQSGRYQAVLTLENGHWKIKTLTLTEYLNE